MDKVSAKNNSNRGENWAKWSRKKQNFKNMSEQFNHRIHRRECPAITYMAMASGHVRSRSEECMGRALGGWRKLKKITRFSFPLLLKRKKYFTNPSCLPHWQRKMSPRSTALVSRIGLQPILRTRWYLALVPCSATAVEADFGVRPKVRQYTTQVLKRTESLIVPKTSHTQALGSAGAAEK